MPEVYFSPEEPWGYTHVRQEYCKDTSCETCGGTGSYYSSEENVRFPCMEEFEKSTGRKVREETVTYMNHQGDLIEWQGTRWLYVDDGTEVPGSLVEG